MWGLGFWLRVRVCQTLPWGPGAEYRAVTGTLKHYKPSFPSTTILKTTSYLADMLDGSQPSEILTKL